MPLCLTAGEQFDADPVPSLVRLNDQATVSLGGHGGRERSDCSPAATKAVPAR